MSKFGKFFKKAKKSVEAFVEKKVVPFVENSAEKIDIFVEKKARSFKKSIDKVKDGFCKKHCDKQDEHVAEEDTSVPVSKLPTTLTNDIEVTPEITTLAGVDSDN